MILTLLIMLSVAFLFGYLTVWVLAAIFNPWLQRLVNITSGDPHRLTSRKAQSITEKQARDIWGDAEVDRYLQYGDYDPPPQIHPYTDNERL